MLVARRLTQGGQTSTVVETTEIANPSAHASDSSGGTNGGGGSSHTGAIVGGVVGGIVVLALLLIGGMWLYRRRKQDDFDGNFDPDRVVARDSLRRGGRGEAPDLLAPGADAEAHPYTYGMQQAGSGGASFYGPGSGQAGPGGFHPGPGVGAAAAGAGLGAGLAAGAAYGGRDDQRSYGVSSGSHYDDPTSEGGSSSGAGDGRGGAGRPSFSSGSGSAGPYAAWGGAAGAAYGAGQRHPSPGPSLPGTATTSSGGPPVSAKEREAFSRRYDNGPAGSQQQFAQMPEPQPYGGGGYGIYGVPGPLAVRNATDGDEAGSVVVHQDGGRIPQPEPDEVEAPNEIPPTYESIKSDEAH